MVCSHPRGGRKKLRAKQWALLCTANNQRVQTFGQPNSFWAVCFSQKKIQWAKTFPESRISVCHLCPNLIGRAMFFANPAHCFCPSRGAKDLIFQNEMLNEAVVCSWKWHLCVRGMFLLLCPLYAQFLLLLFWTIFKFELLSQGGTDRRRIFVIRNSSNSKLLCLWRCNQQPLFENLLTLNSSEGSKQLPSYFSWSQKTFVKQESAKTLLQNGINPEKFV